MSGDGPTSLRISVAPFRSKAKAWCAVVVVIFILAYITFGRHNGVREHVKRNGSLAIAPDHAHAYRRSAEESSEQELEFQLTNNSADLLHIESVTSTCNCTVVDRPQRRDLKPGDSVPLRVRVTVPSSGESNVMVKVTVESKSREEFTIPITLHGSRLEVPSAVHVPDRIEIRGYDGAACEQRQFLVKTYEGVNDPPGLVGFDSTASSVRVTQVELLQRHRHQEYVYAEYLCTLEAVMPSGEQTRTAAWLDPRTSAASKLRLPRVFVLLERMQAIEVNPAVVNVSAADGWVFPIARTVLMTSNTGETFSLENVTDEIGSIAVQADSSDAALLHSVTLVFRSPPDNDPSSRIARHDLRFRTSLPGQREVVLPVVFQFP